MTDALAQRHLDRALAALAVRRYAVAEREAREALTLRPHWLRARHALARAMFGLRRRDEAIAFARESVGVDPRDEYAWYLLGFFLLSQDRMMAARDALSRAAELAPRAAYILSSLALTAARTGSPDEARALVQNALANDGASDRLVLLDVVAVHLHLGDHELAEHTAQQLLALAPDDAASHETLAKVLLARGKTAQAYFAAQRTISMDPNDTAAWRCMAHAAMQLRWFDKSEHAYRELWRLEPDNPIVARQLADTLEKKGDYTGLLAHCRDAVTRFPDDAFLERMLASLV